MESRPRRLDLRTGDTEAMKATSRAASLVTINKAFRVHKGSKQSINPDRKWAIITSSKGLFPRKVNILDSMPVAIISILRVNTLKANTLRANIPRATTLEARLGEPMLLAVSSRV